MRLGYSQFGQCTLKVDCLEKELRLSIPVFYVGAPQVHLFTSPSFFFESTINSNSSSPEDNRELHDRCRQSGRWTFCGAKVPYCHFSAKEFYIEILELFSFDE